MPSDVVGSPGVWPEPVPSGSLEECVSVFGVYDQIGNYWEWVDLGVITDADGFLAARAAEGWSVTREGDALRFDSPLDMSGWTLKAMCTDVDFIGADPEGYLEISLRNPAPTECGGAGQGYLVPRTAPDLHQSGIRNSAFAGMRTKDALVDRLRERTGARPSVDRRDPDLRIDVHVREENGTISIDTSGDSLHRRGYRTDTVQAPIQETLAAAILEIAEWNGERPLIDPMCGSGTFLAEGLMRATKTPAGFFRRHFGLFHLPDFESDLWNEILDEAEAQIREPEVEIQGSDLDKRVVASARRNLGHLPHGRMVRVFRSDFRDHPPIRDALVVCNPPYGVRLKAGEDLSGFYRDFGDFLKQKCTGCSAFVYFGERAWLKSIGLRPEWKRPLMNGGLDGRLARFELY